MSKKILIVEDEVPIADVYKEVLVDEGFDVDVSYDGDSALDKILNSSWDLLFLDIMLPRLDGIEVLKKLKASPSLVSKPVVIVTQIDTPAVADRCKELGVKDYLVKSAITPADIVRVAKFILGV